MSGSFTPISISNCALWLDAADSSTLTLSGSDVTGWTDKSGKGADINSLSSTKPTYNGSNAVVFSASSATFLRGSLDSTYSSNASLFIIGTYSSNSASPVFLPRLMILGSNSGSENALVGQLNVVAQSTIPQLCAYTGTGTSPTPLGINILTNLNASFDSPFLYENISTYDTASRIFAVSTFLNGNTSVYSSYSDTFTLSSFYINNYNKYTIGGYVNTTVAANGDSYNGSVSEALLFTRVLSSSERYQIEGYLAWKWNLDSFLPDSHPYKNSPPPNITPSSNILPIISTPPFTGIEYVKRPFSYTFSSTVGYPTIIQFTDSTPSLLSSISGDTFASTTGFQGTPGSAGTLVVDAITLSNTAYTSLLAGYADGFTDGVGSNARFNYPAQMAFDGSGNLFVADYSNYAIRKIAPDGAVSTFVEDVGVQPTGLTIDRFSNLYVSLTGEFRIVKITPSGVVTNLAGDGTIGFADGTGAAARFSFLSGLTIDSNTSEVYVADAGNNSIRKVTSSGVVTTVAGTGITGSIDGPASNAQFNDPRGVLIASDGNLYVADGYNNKIRRSNISLPYTYKQT